MALGVLLQQRMAPIRSFRDLDVWQRGMDLVDEVIRQSRNLPRAEFDLRRQVQRAAISIPANIAEGWRRKRRRGAYQNHVSIAMGSQGELETEMEVAFRNGWLSRDRCRALVELNARVGAMLERLHDSLD
ncbi:MAG: four helix bundle protein [Vicinamibacterales bacterium]